MTRRLPAQGKNGRRPPITEGTGIPDSGGRVAGEADGRIRRDHPIAPVDGGYTESLRTSRNESARPSCWRRPGPPFSGKSSRMRSRIRRHLKPGLAKKQSIRELGGRHDALSQMLQKSTKAAEGLRKKLAKARADFARAEACRDPRPLKDALRRAQRAARCWRPPWPVERQTVDETEQATIELARLPLWQKSLEELEKAALPADETVSRHRNRARRARAKPRQSKPGAGQPAAGIRPDRENQVAGTDSGSPG